MNADMNGLRARWNLLRPQERLSIGGGVLAVLAVLIYLYALAPLYASLEARAGRVADKQADLAWIRSVAPEVATLAAAQPAMSAPSDESLVVLVDRTAREGGLGDTLTGQTPAGGNGIRVRLENAPFDTVVQWIGSLQQQHGLEIDQATVDRTDAPGRVNVNLTLVRPGTG